MIRQDILDFLAARPRPGPRPECPFEREQIAAAALMVECAQVDTEFAQEEREAICRAVRGDFGLDAATCEALVEVAERRTEEVWHDWLFLQAVKQGFTEEEQRGILTRLWEVAHADGEVHPFEVSLISRIARELGFTEAVLEETRAEARKRMGGAPETRHH
jgi:uncharacterized tellurite resistance protein B-like protein